MYALVGCHVQVDGEVVVLGCAIELELGRVASSGNDLVALGKTLLDKFGAETCRGSCNEEDFGCHFDLLCFEELEDVWIERNQEWRSKWDVSPHQLPFGMMMVLTSKWTQLLTPPKSGEHSKPFSSSVPWWQIPRWKSTNRKSSPLSTLTIWQETARLLRIPTLMPCFFSLELGIRGNEAIVRR